MTNEEATAAKAFADEVGANVSVMVDSIGPIKMKSRTEWLLGTQAAPNFRGVAKIVGEKSQDDLMNKGADGVDVLFVSDTEFSERAKDPAVMANLRKAKFLVVEAWAATHPLTEIADVVLPGRIHAEKDGTFVNLQNREQEIAAAYPAKGQTLPNDEVFRRVREAMQSREPALSHA